MKFKIFKGADAKFYISLVARNGRIVLSSEGYNSKQAAQHAARIVKDQAMAAEVVDEA